MQIEVAPESRGALIADGTLRCLFQARYTPVSRHSSVAISFARGLVKEFTDALLKHIADADTGVDTGADPKPAADVYLNVVTLRRGKRLFICYDVFLAGCREEVRHRVEEAVDRPIHGIYEDNGVYRLRREPVWDARVSVDYAHLKKVDKGPRPYFTDSKEPALL